MALCHFYGWTVDEVRNLSVEEYEAAIEWHQKVNKKK